MRTTAEIENKLYDYIIDYPMYVVTYTDEDESDSVINTINSDLSSQLAGGELSLATRGQLVEWGLDEAESFKPGLYLYDNNAEDVYEYLGDTVRGVLSALAHTCVNSAYLTSDMSAGEEEGWYHVIPTAKFKRDFIDMYPFADMKLESQYF